LFVCLFFFFFFILFSWSPWNRGMTECCELP
jgi:hypothetical protein